MLDWTLLPIRLAISFLIAIPWLIGYILGFPMVAIGLLFCNKESIHMPKLFWLWDSYAGINGILNGHNENWLKICGSEEATKTYRNRWIFLAWRNPCGNLGGELLSCPMPRQNTRMLIETKWFQYQVSWPFWHIRIANCRFGWKLNDKGFFMFRITWRKP